MQLDAVRIPGLLHEAQDAGAKFGVDVNRVNDAAFGETFGHA